MITIHPISTLNTKVRWLRSIFLESFSVENFARFVQDASFVNGRVFMSMNYARIGKGRKHFSRFNRSRLWSKTMTLLPQVIEAKYVSGYKIELLFNTGVRKTVDFTRWLHGPVFEPLRNRVEFRKFFIAGGTVCWPNGADIAPETLFAVRGESENAA